MSKHDEVRRGFLKGAAVAAVAGAACALASRAAP
jgi:hypothetical protein